MRGTNKILLKLVLVRKNMCVHASEPASLIAMMFAISIEAISDIRGKVQLSTSAP